MPLPIVIFFKVFFFFFLNFSCTGSLLLGLGFLWLQQAVVGLLLVVVSLTVAHDLIYSMPCGIFPTRAQTHVPRRNLNRWITREICLLLLNMAGDLLKLEMDGSLFPFWFQKRIFCRTLFKDPKSYSHFDC